MISRDPHHKGNSHDCRLIFKPLHWRHNGHDSVSNHQPYDCLLNCLFRRRSKIISKLRVTGLCVGNSPVTGEFPAQMASNAENVSIWWRHHDCYWLAVSCAEAMLENSWQMTWFLKQIFVNMLFNNHFPTQLLAGSRFAIHSETVSENFR